MHDYLRFLLKILRRIWHRHLSQRNAILALGKGSLFPLYKKDYTWNAPKLQTPYNQYCIDLFFPAADSKDESDQWFSLGSAQILFNKKNCQV